jgi:hypothetical protein
MRSTRLKLQTVSAACMVEAGRLPPGDHGDSICVVNMQPDLVLDHCWCRDLSRGLDYWISAAPSTLTRNCFLQIASKNYAPASLSWWRCGHIWKVGGRCQVLIIPWVVGVRGMVDAKSVLEILDFLRVSRQRRAKNRGSRNN